MPRGGFREAARGRVGRPLTPASVLAKVEQLRKALERRPDLGEWTDAEIDAVVKALKDVAGPYEAAQFGRWQDAAERDEE